MDTFSAEIQIIGVNPYVEVPEAILASLFQQAGKSKGQIPIRGYINQQPFTQTLVRYSGAWRLYINTTMLPKSPQRIGERVTLEVMYDPSDRSIQPHPAWIAALAQNPAAKAVFDSLPPSRQKEIVRYIASLKTEASVEKNIARSIGFLLGEGRFVGREKP